MDGGNEQRTSDEVEIKQDDDAQTSTDDQTQPNPRGWGCHPTRSRYYCKKLGGACHGWVHDIHSDEGFHPALGCESLIQRVL